MRRSWKPLIFTGPGVRIPLFPLRAVEILLFCFYWYCLQNLQAFLYLMTHLCKYIYKSDHQIQTTQSVVVSIKTGERIVNFVQGVTSSANREPQIATTLPRRWRLPPFESLCSSVQGAPRRAKGKTSRHEVATKSIPLFPPAKQRWFSSLLFFVVKRGVRSAGGVSGDLSEYCYCLLSQILVFA